MQARPFAVFLPLLCLAFLGCDSAQGAGAETSATTNRNLTLVSERAEVCMVNNQYMGRAQIPVVVEGRTYFGCCEMCKGRLVREEAARTAIDPLSGRKVDKATAVIAQDPAGAVVYFENEANFASYLKGTR